MNDPICTWRVWYAVSCDSTWRWAFRACVALCMRSRWILWHNTVLWGWNCFGIGHVLATFCFAQQQAHRPPCCNCLHGACVLYCCFARIEPLFKRCSLKKKITKRILKTESKKNRHGGIWAVIARWKTRNANQRRPDRPSKSQSPMCLVECLVYGRIKRETKKIALQILRFASSTLNATSHTAWKQKWKLRIHWKRHYWTNCQRSTSSGDTYKRSNIGFTKLMFFSSRKFANSIFDDKNPLWKPCRYLRRQISNFNIHWSTFIFEHPDVELQYTYL